MTARWRKYATICVSAACALALVLLILSLQLGSPSTAIQYTLDSMAYGSLYALMALGLSLLFGVMGLMNFAYGELIMAGAYTMFFTRSWGWLGMILITIGDIWLHHYGDEQQAKTLYQQGLHLWQDLQRVDNGLGIVKALAGLAEVAAAQGQAERAGRLFGTADHLLPAESLSRDDLNRRVAEARAHLDATAFTTGWTAGQAMTDEQAVTDALQDA